jgi:hypothetical protein
MDNLAAVLIFISNLLLAIATFVSAIQKQSTRLNILLVIFIRILKKTFMLFQ